MFLLYLLFALAAYGFGCALNDLLYVLSGRTVNFPGRPDRPSDGATSGRPKTPLGGDNAAAATAEFEGSGVSQIP
jgi:hypothetical protein